VPAVAVRDGLLRFTPDPHRVATVATIDGVDYVDDSKATNPHAAAASLAAALLPVAESIDPMLVPELFWQAVSFRLYSGGLGIGDERQLVSVPLLLARYDRQVAETIFKRVADIVMVEPGTGIEALWSAAAAIDAIAAVEMVERLPADRVHDRVILSSRLVLEDKKFWSKANEASAVPLIAE
jgi:hypothetical protein